MMDQRRLSVSSLSSLDSNQDKYDYACMEGMNALEMQSEWESSNVVWDEPPCTSGYRGTTPPAEHIEQRLSVSSLDRNQDKFNDFTTHTTNEAMNAVELSSEVSNPVSNKEPNTSSDYRDPATPVKSSQCLVCPTCSKSFSRKDALKRHMKTHSNEKLFTCQICEKSFARKDHLMCHMKTHSVETDFKCDICDKSFQRKHCFAMHMKKHQEKKFDCRKCDRSFISLQNLNQHVKTHHPEAKLTSVKRSAAPPAGNSKRARRGQGALNTFTSTFFPPSERSKKDFLLFFKEITPQLEGKICEEINDKGAVKWYGVVKAVFKRETYDGEEETATPYFRSNVQIELVSDTVGDHIPLAFLKVTEAIEEFIRRGSGWVLDKIIQFELCVAKYHPLRASSYIPLPKKLADKKAVLNIRNEDQKCLVWCLIAHKLNLHTHDNFRVSHYTPHEHEIKLDGVACPILLNKIPVIERLNNLRINVFGYEENQVFPLHVSKRENEDCINLLLIATEATQHYCLIKNMSRLLGDLTKYNGRCHYCYRCLHRFVKADTLEEHFKYCNAHSPQHIKMPAAGENIVKFVNVHYQQPLPYIIYADFESLIVKEVHTKGNSETIARHVACGYAYIIIGPDGRSVKPITVYRGENAVQHFMINILKEKDELAAKLTSIVPIIMTPQDELNFRSATHCSICKKVLKGDRVRDHDHLTGRYRGALHSSCNLKFRLSKKIPVVFHNLRNYDGHLIMQEIGKLKDYEISVVPTTMEKYITFSLTKRYQKFRVSLNFIDSYQFLSTSLEKLVKNLTVDKFNILKENFPHRDISLLLRKGVYPYEYMDSFQKFEEPRLPSIQSFESILTGSGISVDDYRHAQSVWNYFHLKNMGDYHDLYVKSDVLQLADVFENFRKLCQIYYGLDCVHLFTAPGLAWQSSLKMTDQPLELFTDINMHLFIEQGIRGGISVITKRFSEANNKYLPTFDMSKSMKHIIYLDCNNLYGASMVESLPYGGFEWISADVSLDWIQSIPQDSSEGYIFEVDLEYPQELHDLHNDYPLAPEKMNIQFEDLSEFSKVILDEMKYVSSTKLVPNLKNKTNYITYYKNLQFYIKHGLKIEKIHKILKFQQKPWLKKYIMFNTEQRKNSKSAFEKDFFKLMNNSVYGKTMENIRNRVDVQLVHDEQKAQKLVAAPTFKRFQIFDNELVGVERSKKCLTLDKPIYVGFVILELSKLIMYDFHYNVIKKEYGDRAQLLFTDTDSLTYEVETEDIFQDMSRHMDIYDTSDYPRDHFLFSESNKKKIGCFKDELHSKPIIEFIGLRAKMYSIKSECGEKKTAKGVARSVVEKNVRHEDYRRRDTDGSISVFHFQNNGSEMQIIDEPLESHLSIHKTGSEGGSELLSFLGTKYENTR
ncbi:unnamed protein product [Larinioides sclopetarius]|uniref:C2H2-type domain-containing protein n=1 Tax=Larinioides sclopetarius TaxID=280406 RepID=A0AAV2BE94_9ARAC